MIWTRDAGLIRFNRGPRTHSRLVESSSTRPGQWDGAGRWFYFDRVEQENRSIFRIDPDDPNRVEAVLVAKTQDGRPSVSENGKTLVFERVTGTSDTDVWMLDLDSGVETQLTAESGNQGRPWVSPNGMVSKYGGMVVTPGALLSIGKAARCRIIATSDYHTN